jgi:NAD(P)-dependent dehydrogenase (short-subunit alcohol dehydrogenase family)
MAYQGKVALVTGGGSGMGRLAAQQMAATGAQVAILDVNQAGMLETADGQANIHPYVVDITDYDAVCTAVTEFESQHGPLDRVYNCAAIMPFGKLTEADPGLMNKMMMINYGGLVCISRATLPGMVERGSGDFVSFASAAGLIPGLLMGGYNASKAAVAMYTEVLYHENLNSGVRFACVCPPAVATPLLDQGKETAWPKLMEMNEGDEINPPQVLAAIEGDLEKGNFWVFVTGQTKFGAWMRRVFPNLVWKNIHKIEGW